MTTETEVDLSIYNTDRFHCVRVYPDGSAKETFRDALGCESWTVYNSQHRGGNSLFINGVWIKDTGVIDMSRIARIERLLKEELPTRINPVVQQGQQYEVWGGQAHVRQGYPDDKDRARVF